MHASPFSGLNIKVVEPGQEVRPFGAEPLTVTEENSVILGGTAFMTEKQAADLKKASK